MASVVKVLGQTDPTASALTTLYTVPALTNTVISTVFACNRSTVDTTIRVAVRPAGAAIADQHYLYYDLLLPANNAFAVTAGLTLAATDVLSVSSLSGLVSFSAFGEEVS